MVLLGFGIQKLAPSPGGDAEEAGPTAATVADALCSLAGGSSPFAWLPSFAVMLHGQSRGGM